MKRTHEADGTAGEATAPQVLQDAPGAAWEKRGNSLWVACPACATWFPTSPALQRPQAVAACCPRCHREFKLAASSSPR